MSLSSPFRDRHVVAPYGYTLIEVLIVIACILIAAMVLLPTGGHDGSTRLRAAASILIADLEYAQAVSIGNDVNRCAMVVIPSGNRYYLARQASLTDPMENPVGRGPYQVAFGEGAFSRLSGVTIAADSDTLVSFNSLGALDQGSDGLIVLRCGSDTIKVRIDSSTGYPSTE